jgi:hypothetical protein
MQEKCMHDCHDTSDACHVGQYKILEKLRQSAIWYNMTRDGKLYMQTFAINTINQLGVSSQNWINITLVSQWKGSTWTFWIRCRFRNKATSSHSWLLTNLKYGWHDFRLQTRRLELFPKHWWITSSPDCDAQYNCITTKGRTWKETLSDNFVTLLQTKTILHHPSSNGMVERYNRTILHTISCFLKSKQQDWDWWLGKTCWSN